ncbi:MAG: hypothetical protein ACRDYU_03850 [Actinomycetes bacterium]
MSLVPDDEQRPDEPIDLVPAEVTPAPSTASVVRDCVLAAIWASAVVAVLYILLGG